MPETFAAVVWRGGTETAVEQLELIEPVDPRYVVVRVTAANVNISDHLFLRPENVGGPMPLPQVLGHGGVGIVERVGEGSGGIAIGDRVLMLGTPECGACWFCEHGRPDWCAELQFVGPAVARTRAGEDVYGSAAVGSFAELAIVPANQLLRLETELPDDQLALLTVGFGAGVGAGLIIAPPEPGDAVAVVGLGTCGLSFIQAARLAGATTIIGVDPVAARRERALATGATHVVDPAEVDAVAEVRRLGGDRGGPYGAGTGADIVFEASTSVDGMQQAWQMAPVTGTVVLSSVPMNMASEVALPATPLACYGKRTLGSQYGGIGIRRDLPRIIGLMEDGSLDAAALLDAEYGLDEVPAAIHDVAALSVLGATIYPARRTA